MARLRIPRKLKHNKHPFTMLVGPFETKMPGLVHAGKITCRKCNVMLKWASQHEVDCYNHWDIDKSTEFDDFIKFCKEITPFK